MKVLVCPDKFKGSLSAEQVCSAIEVGLKRFDRSTEVTKIPLADGGEGTLDLLEKVLNLERVYVTVNDPLSRPISTYYLTSKTTAYIEMAKASGLQLLSEEERNPLYTTTFGTGELIGHALDQGIEEVFLLIGGSATNDGGVGMASALGYEFLKKNAERFSAIGAGLLDLKSIGSKAVHRRLAEVRFTVLSDVASPLTGPHGATHVYGMQKGANSSAIVILEDGLKHLSKLLSNGKENIPGAGGAGGLGYGALSFLNARIESGIETIMQILGIEKHLENVDLIITGEGKLDSQTGQGKVVMGVVRFANENNIPIGIICGINETLSQLTDPKMIYQIINIAKNLEDAMVNAFDLVSQRAQELATRFWKTKP